MTSTHDTKAVKNVGVRHSKKVSSACLLCKQRKRRCSAQLPCEGCIASGSNCVYSEMQDGRRRETIRRVRVDSAFHKKLVYGLLDKLRYGQTEDLVPFLDDNVSLEDLAAYLERTSSPSTISPVDAVSDSTLNSKHLVKHEDPGEEYGKGLLRSFKSLSANHRILHPAPNHLEVTSNPPSFSTSPPPSFDPHSRPLNVSASDLTQPPYLIQPYNFPTEPASITTLLTHFRDTARDAIRLGTPEEKVLGPREVNLDTALNGRRVDSSFTPSTWICELQRQFASFDVYVRLSLIYLTNQYLRWSISATPENYDLVPECMRPTLSQCVTPHHSAIDICFLPAFRDILIQRDYPGNVDEREDIIAFQLAGLRTGWQGSWDEAVVFDPRLGYHTLTPTFIESACKVDQWIAGGHVHHRFPELSNAMLFAEEGTVRFDDRQLHELFASRACA